MAHLYWGRKSLGLDWIHTEVLGARIEKEASWARKVRLFSGEVALYLTPFYYQAGCKRSLKVCRDSGQVEGHLDF